MPEKNGITCLRLLKKIWGTDISPRENRFSKKDTEELSTFYTQLTLTSSTSSYIDISSYFSFLKPVF